MIISCQHFFNSTVTHFTTRGIALAWFDKLAYLCSSVRQTLLLTVTNRNHVLPAAENLNKEEGHVKSGITRLAPNIIKRLSSDTRLDQAESKQV